MKHLSLIILLALFATLPLAAQTVQKGVTLQYQGKKSKTPLSGVNIVASGASTNSAKNGTFTLTFKTLTQGQKVNVNRIYKSGYVIFNKDALDQWYVTERTETFKIVLVKAEYFDDLVNTYYGVSMQSYADQLKKAQDEAKRLYQEKKIQAEDYERKLREADAAYQRSMNQLQNNAELMARIDESELDSLDLHALDLVKAGRMDEAVELVKQKKTSELIEQTVKKREEAIALQQHFMKMQQEASEQLIRLVASRKNDIKILQSQGGKENIDLSKQYWKEIAEADLTNITNTFECAVFLHSQKDFEAAEHYYNITLERCRELAAANPEVYNYHLATTLSNVAALHNDINHFSQAEQEYLETLVIRRQLAATQQKTYLLDLSRTLNGLGTLYYKYRRYDQAEQEFTESLAIYRQLTGENSEDYYSDLATVLNNLGILHGDITENYDLAEQEYKESLAIYRQLVSEKPQIYNRDLADGLLNLAGFYYMLDNNDLAEEGFTEALAIYRQLATSNPESNNPSLALGLFNLAHFHASLGRDSLAEQEYLESLAIRRQLAEANPEAFGPDVPGVLTNLGVIHIKNNQYDLAEQELTEAMEIRRNLAMMHPEKYRLDFSRALVNLASLHEDLKKNSQMEQEMVEALDIRRELAAEDPESYNAYFASLLMGVAINYRNQKRYPELEAITEERIAVAGAMGKSSDEIAMLKGSLSNSQLFNGKFEAAEQTVREVLASDESQTWIKSNLVLALLLQGRYAEAKALAREVKDIEIDGETLGASLLEDLTALEEYGAIPSKRMSDVKRMRALLIDAGSRSGKN